LNWQFGEQVQEVHKAEAKSKSGLAESGIVTNSDYRRRGLAAATFWPSRVQILQSIPRPFSRAKRAAAICRKNSGWSRSVIEPIVLRFEADQDTGRSAVPSDDDFFNSCQV